MKCSWGLVALLASCGSKGDSVPDLDAPGSADAALGDMLIVDTAVAPPGDNCAEPVPLTANVAAQPFTTIGASDQFGPTCLALDGADVVHSIDTSAAGARAVLVSVTPTSPDWPLAAALTDAACPATNELSCIAGAFGTRYINRPNLPGGQYFVQIDGASGASGGYTIKYETRVPDTTFGYWRIESSESYAPLAGGTAVPGFAAGVASDEASWSVPLPFAFDFYGEPKTSVTISANLYLTFGSVPSGAESYTNDCIQNTTAPNDMIAVFWDDAAPPSDAELLTRTEGTAPHRRFIIEWKNWDFAVTRAGEVSLQGARLQQQAILYENGDIELRYGPRVWLAGAFTTLDCGTTRIGGCGATLGIENASGADVDAGQCNMATVSDGKVIRWIRPR